MRKKHSHAEGKPEKESKVKNEVSPTTVVSSARDPTSPEFWPYPDDLFREAEAEPNYRNLSAYSATIGLLREKRFSYREIAEWFSERGVFVDHNAVYRTYTNSLPGDLAQREEENTALEEHERDRLDGVV